MSKLKSSSSKLSFSMEDEGDVDECFVVKKDVTSKQFKKMRQAPPASSLNEIEKPMAAYPTFGSSYSSETLEQLRSSQKFLAKPISEAANVTEGVELSGDAAEQFTDITQKLYNSSGLGSVPMSVEDEFDMVEDSADFMAFKMGQMSSKNILKGRVQDRIHMLQKEKKEQLDLSEDNDDEWEREVMRRGVISGTAALRPSGGAVNTQSRMAAPSSSSAQGTYSTASLPTGATLRESLSSRPSSSRLDTSGLVSVSDMTHMVQLAVDKLKISIDGKDSRIEQLRVAEGRSKDALTRHKEVLGAEVDKLNIIQDLRLFFSSLVGLVRAKVPLVEELRQAALDTARSLGAERQRRRVEEQEDLLYRVKETGELMAIGDYAPSAIMRSSVDSNSDSVHAVLLSRETARRQHRLALLDKSLASHTNNSSKSSCENSDFSVLPSLVASTAAREWIAQGRLDEALAAATVACNSPLSDTVVDSLQRLLCCVDLVASSSTETSDSEVTARLSLLSSAVEAAMSDAAPEAYSMTAITQQLTVFRAAYPERYRTAFISLSLPELLEPLIRHDLLTSTGDLLSALGGGICCDTAIFNHLWAAPFDATMDMEGGDKEDGDPEAGEFSICGREWHEPLREFSASDSGTEANGEDTAAATVETLVEEGDSNLLPKLVVSVVLPFVADLVSASLDVMSSPACARAATLLASLLDYDPSVDQLQPLLEAVVGAFDREIAATCVPVVKHYTAPSCALTAVASGGVAVPGVGKSFAVRQMVRVSLMVRNLAHFREYLAPQAVMRLAWRCLNGLCLAPAVRLLSSPDFQSVHVVLQVVESVISMIDGVDGGSISAGGRSAHERALAHCGVDVAAFRELKLTISKISHIRATLSWNDIRVQLLQALSKM